METPKLSLAEWIYLSNPLASQAHELIAYTILELIFLGALKVETRNAHHYAPRDPHARGMMQYFCMGENVDKFHFQAHQEAILRKIDGKGGTSIPELFKKLINHFGEDGKTFRRTFIIPRLQDKNILKYSYPVFNSLELSLPARSKKKAAFKKQMSHAQRLHIPIEPDYLCEYGPIVLWASGNLSRELRGKTVEKSAFVSSIYAYNLKEGISLEDLNFCYPPFPVENFLKIAEKRFTADEHAKASPGQTLLHYLFAFLRSA